MKTFLGTDRKILTGKSLTKNEKDENVSVNFWYTTGRINV